MVEIRNVEVCGLERAVNAISNSFNVGDIDTTAPVVGERPWKVAKALGGNMDSHQSHDAWLCGVGVDFEMKCDDEFYNRLARERYFTICPLKSGWLYVNTNYRAIKHFLGRYKDAEFLDLCKGKMNRFSEMTGITKW